MKPFWYNEYSSTDAEIYNMESMDSNLNPNNNVHIEDRIQSIKKEIAKIKENFGNIPEPSIQFKPVERGRENNLSRTSYYGLFNHGNGFSEEGDFELNFNRIQTVEDVKAVLKYIYGDKVFLKKDNVNFDSDILPLLTATRYTVFTIREIANYKLRGVTFQNEEPEEPNPGS